MATRVSSTPSNRSATRHHAKECPILLLCPKKQNPPAQQNQNNNQRPARPPFSGKVNHVSTDTAQEAPEVMMGGDRISVDVAMQHQPTVTVNQLSGGNQEDQVVDEFPDVFPDELPAAPLPLPPPPAEAAPTARRSRPAPPTIHSPTPRSVKKWAVRAAFLLLLPSSPLLVLLPSVLAQKTIAGAPPPSARSRRSEPPPPPIFALVRSSPSPRPSRPSPVQFGAFSRPCCELRGLRHGAAAFRAARAFLRPRKG
ncbi:formin-like protein 6 [Sorghum bicolor]|uniref:formin-like protein 6 n=1 Tax=Sorghum bicolor TaxID=4558 RepID=UPI000B424C0B|nr:formin-like protein 6 [Sorghum bicolor]|eukprot:XP_021315132.1 formin-like protein 6 [Sorghum bicolor]